jgi:pimeloyl-ACP methyl ester carboxylesterase
MTGRQDARNRSLMEALHIARQGSLEAGGSFVYSATNDGEDPDNWRWPAGHVHIEHVHAAYQYPVDQRYDYPIVFNPGGGHSARVYDTTPDGREGWLTLFLRAGFAVYGVDRVNTGRSGTDITKINEVRLGRAPASALPALNRYSAESCWTTFRWGPVYGEPFADTQFPIEHAADYYPQTLSSYRDPDEDGKSVDAFVELFHKIGAATLQTWSSSGLLGYLAAARMPALVKGILAIESSVSAFDKIPDTAVDALANVPIIVIIGDRAEDRNVATRAFAERLRARGGDITVDILPEAGIYGNGHTLMLEKNNVEIMHRMIAWLRSHVYVAKPR